MADYIQIPIPDQTPPTEAIKDEIEARKKLDHLIVEMNELSNSSTKSATIFKVNVGLRRANPAAYTPMLISIGPYHHNKSPNFRSMEKYKLLYLQRFLNRNEGIDVGSCMRELEKVKEEALMCYDDKENLDKEIVGKFLEIMLVDGCFLVEFIRERFGIRPRGEEHYQLVIDKAWMRNQVREDMVVLENQLPFFVLTMLHGMTKCPDEESFLYMVTDTLCEIYPKKRHIPKSEIDSLDAEPFDHLLHVVHMISCPSERINSRQHTDFSKRKGFCNVNIFSGKILQRMKRSKEIPDNPNINIPSATELYEAGVSFTKIGSAEEDDKDTTSLLDIKYESGLLEIPCIEVQDSTETFLRNLIAYEQHSSNVYTYFSDYIAIMDRLINSPEDVQLLRESKIISNYLGDDKVVAKIFNKLGDGVVVDFSNSYYKEQCRKLNQHCQKRWNKIMANLRHTYFHSLWAGTSTVAAIVLLILTAMQTVLAFTGSVK